MTGGYLLESWCTVTAPGGYVDSFRRLQIELVVGRLQISWGEVKAATPGINFDTSAPSFGKGWPSGYDGAPLLAWQVGSWEWESVEAIYRVKVRQHQVSMPTWPLLAGYVLIWGIVLTWRRRRVEKLARIEGPIESTKERQHDC